MSIKSNDGDLVSELGIGCFVQAANDLIKTDYSAFIDFCNSHDFRTGTDHGADPFLADYTHNVLQEYLAVAGLNEYCPDSHERAHFTDVNAPLIRQFPFSTGDHHTIGRYLMGVGHLVRNIGVPTGSHILEYGAGWAHVAFALGQAGYNVACVDIEPGFVELINNRAVAEQVSVKAFHGHFGFKPPQLQVLDAIVFFEAFHHSLDHVDLVGKLYRMLRPGGRLLLGGESIYPWFPIPWGIRLDGHAVWAIRNYGWMELGFSEAYLIKLLIKHGFAVAKQDQPDIGPLGSLYVGTKLDNVSEAGGSLLPVDEEASWNPSGESGLRFATERSTLSVADMVGWSALTAHLQNFLPLPVSIMLQLGDSRSSHTVGAGELLNVSLTMPRHSGPLTIISQTHCPLELGVNDDPRHLGIALLSISYR